LEVDLIFLDINMPKMNGLQFLRSGANLPMVIMTTAYGQYALEGFEMSVIDYLVKPFSLERFLKASQRAFEFKLLKQKNSSSVAAEYFYVKCDGKFERIVYDELIYVEAMANYITLHTLSNKFIVYLTVKGLLEKLPQEKFLQVHKSYVVNLNQINSIEGNVLHLGKTKITIGLSFNEKVMERLLKNNLLKR
jgi:DNA-binding LytR/AlgR family response regulator